MNRWGLKEAEIPPGKAHAGINRMTQGVISAVLPAILFAAGVAIFAVSLRIA